MNRYFQLLFTHVSFFTIMTVSNSLSIFTATYMYTYTSMATGEEVPNVRTSRTPSEDHGFTQDWVNNHANRAAQRQLEVHDNPSGQPRTQIHTQEEEERKLS